MRAWKATPASSAACTSVAAARLRMSPKTPENRTGATEGRRRNGEGRKGAMNPPASAALRLRPSVAPVKFPSLFQPLMACVYGMGVLRCMGSGQSVDGAGAGTEGVGLDAEALQHAHVQ